VLSYQNWEKRVPLKFFPGSAIKRCFGFRIITIRPLKADGPPTDSVQYCQVTPG
jgi:hypothetical protein